MRAEGAHNICVWRNHEVRREVLMGVLLGSKTEAHRASIHTQTFHYNTSTNTYIIFPTCDPRVAYIHIYITRT